MFSFNNYDFYLFEKGSGTEFKKDSRGSLEYENTGHHIHLLETCIVESYLTLAPSFCFWK